MYDVIFRDKVAHTPCMSLLFREYANIIDAGWSLATVPWSNTDPCVYLEDENKNIVAAMVLRIELDTLWIIFSCVHPDYRGKGVHKFMSLELEKIARDRLNCKRITSLVHAENTAILKASAKVGMLPTWHRMLKIL